MQQPSGLLASLCLSLCLWGCAPLGTYSRFRPGAKASQFSTLGYVIPDVAQAHHSPYHQAVDSLFVRQLSQQLRAVAGQRPIRYIGQLKAGTITSLVLDSLARRNPDLDGLLLCALIVKANDSTLQATSANTKVKLLLVQGATRQVVGQVQFNTRMGKSYWLNPTVAVAIADATAGAIRPFRRFFAASER